MHGGGVGAAGGTEQGLGEDLR
uniref:Uncharacterized protein n=1 Tax=Anguilla anguilla TaxID=7936 RepID=A0A0E9UD23_ANGAN